MCYLSRRADIGLRRDRHRQPKGLSLRVARLDDHRDNRPNVRKADVRGQIETGAVPDERQFLPCAGQDVATQARPRDGGELDTGRLSVSRADADFHRGAFTPGGEGIPLPGVDRVGQLGHDRHVAGAGLAEEFLVVAGEPDCDPRPDTGVGRDGQRAVADKRRQLTSQAERLPYSGVVEHRVGRAQGRRVLGPEIDREQGIALPDPPASRFVGRCQLHGRPRRRCDPSRVRPDAGRRVTARTPAIQAGGIGGSAVLHQAEQGETHHNDQADCRGQHELQTLEEKHF